MPARSADRTVAAGPEEEVRWIVDEATQRVDLFPIDSTRRDEHVCPSLCPSVCSLCDLCHTNNNNNKKEVGKK